MTPLGWVCVAAATAVLLVQSSGRETGPVRESGRQVRTVPAPSVGKCGHIKGGGVFHTHFYVCCNNCDESGGNPTCDRTTYRGRTTGEYCGHCGADQGNGTRARYFRCGGCAGQSHVQEMCNEKYSSYPGFCWIHSYCFQHRCKKYFPQKARRSLASFCGDDTCDKAENTTTCPFDCCPEKNPGDCRRTEGTCPRDCCSQAGCCLVSGSPTVQADTAVSAAIAAASKTKNKH
ncbi:hypothetical protein Bbelb_371010 [Branchiostoma belcheri]|nr:hypothetical protein Bbelb_371010 [Branchiostoma belcheri]